MSKLQRVLWGAACATVLLLTQSGCEPEEEDCWSLTGDLAPVTADTTATKHGEAAVSFDGTIVMFTTDYFFDDIDDEGGGVPLRDLMIVDMPVGGEFRNSVPTPLDMPGARRVSLTGITDDRGGSIGVPEALNQAWPAWHPDGEQFAFTLTNPIGFPRLYVCRLDYGAPDNQPIPILEHRLIDDIGFTQTSTETDDSYYYATPAFSRPDANGHVWVAYGRHFFRPPQGGNPAVSQPQAVYAYNLTTDETVQVTPASSRVQRPAWSPDGAHIAFEANYNGAVDIYRIRFDPTSMTPREDTLRRLTKSEATTGDPVPYESSHPSWMSDGSIIFTSTRRAPCTSQREADIWRMDADGSRQRVLFRSRLYEDYPAAIPSGGNAIVFTTQLNQIPAFVGAQESIVLFTGF